MTDFLKEMGPAYAGSLLLLLMIVFVAMVSVLSEAFSRKGRARKAAFHRKVLECTLKRDHNRP